MIDHFALAVGQGLLLLAAWLLLRRPDLDREGDEPTTGAGRVRDLAFAAFLLALIGAGFRQRSCSCSPMFISTSSSRSD